MTPSRAPARRHRLLLPLLALALLLGWAVAAHPQTPAQAGLAAGTGDRVVLKGDLILQPDEVVAHDAHAVLGNVMVPAGAEVKHDVLASDGSIEIGGMVGHDVTAFNGTVTLLATAQVGGDVSVINGTIDRQSGAQVGGKTHLLAAPPAARDEGLLGFVFSLLVNLVLGILAVAVGTLVILAWPRQAGRVVSILESAPWATVGVGIITGVFILPVALLLSLILAITLVGLLVAWVPPLAVLVAWCYGMIIVGLWVGRRLGESGRLPAAQGSLLVTALAGLGTIAVVTLALTALLPWLGWSLAYFLGFVGFGAAVLSRLGVQGTLVRLPGSGNPRVTHPLNAPPVVPPADRKAS